MRYTPEERDDLARCKEQWILLVEQGEDAERVRRELKLPLKASSLPLHEAGLSDPAGWPTRRGRRPGARTTSPTTGATGSAPPEAYGINNNFRASLYMRPLPKALKQAALEALAQLPEDTVLCHGDFHPDNIVLSARGPVILDWTDATHGHPLADVARTALLMQHAALPPHMPGRWLIESGRALWFWLYLRRYCQLRSVSPGQVEAWLLPMAAARLSEGIPEEEGRLLRLIKRIAI